MIKSFPFPGEFAGLDERGFPVSDRDYSDEDLARYVSDLWLNGVVERNYRPLMVTSSGGMQARINEGSIYINGRYAFIEDEPEFLMLEPGGSLPRIDLISMRLDTSTEVRAITPVIISGESAAEPVMPEIVRRRSASGGIMYDMILASVLVPAGAFSLTQDNITDTRENREICGMVRWLADQVDLDTIHRQYNWLLEEQMAKFNAWFGGLKDILNENTAAYLLSQLERLENKIESTRWLQFVGSASDLDIFKTI